MCREGAILGVPPTLMAASTAVSAHPGSSMAPLPGASVGASRAMAPDSPKKWSPAADAAPARLYDYMSWLQVRLQLQAASGAVAHSDYEVGVARPPAAGPPDDAAPSATVPPGTVPPTPGLPPRHPAPPAAGGHPVNVGSLAPPPTASSRGGRGGGARLLPPLHDSLAGTGTGSRGASDGTGTATPQAARTTSSDDEVYADLEGGTFSTITHEHATPPPLHPSLHATAGEPGGSESFMEGDTEWDGDGLGPLPSTMSGAGVDGGDGDGGLNASGGAPGSTASLYAPHQRMFLGLLANTPSMFVASTMSASAAVDAMGRLGVRGSLGTHSAASASTVPPAEVTLARWDPALKFSESWRREGALTMRTQAIQRDTFLHLARYAENAQVLQAALQLPLITAAEDEVAEWGISAPPGVPGASSVLSPAGSSSSAGWRVASDEVARGSAASLAAADGFLPSPSPRRRGDHEHPGLTHHSLTLMAAGVHPAGVVEGLAGGAAGIPARLRASTPHRRAAPCGGSDDDDDAGDGLDDMPSVASTATSNAPVLPENSGWGRRMGATADPRWAPAGPLGHVGAAAAAGAGMMRPGLAQSRGALVGSDGARPGGSGGGGGGGVAALTNYRGGAAAPLNIDAASLTLPPGLSKERSLTVLAASIAAMPHVDAGMATAVTTRHRTRVSVREMKAQPLNAVARALADGRSPATSAYSNADIAQYAILLSIFAPHAEAEWLASGGAYLGGRAASHDFTAHVIHRVLAANAGPSLHLPPPDDDEDGAPPVLTLPTARSIPSTAAPFSSAAAAFASSASGGGGGGGGGGWHDASLAPTGSALFSAVSLQDTQSVAFASLPALLGDLWNDSLLAMVYHYYLRAHADGAPPLFGEVSAEEGDRRRHAREVMAAYRETVRRTRTAVGNRAIARAGDGLSVVDHTTMLMAAQLAAERLSASRQAAEAAAAEARAAATTKLLAVVATRNAVHDARAAKRHAERMAAVGAEVATYAAHIRRRTAEWEALERERALHAGLNPAVANKKAMRHTLAAVQIAVVEELSKAPE